MSNARYAPSEVVYVALRDLTGNANNKALVKGTVTAVSEMRTNRTDKKGDTYVKTKYLYDVKLQDGGRVTHAWEGFIRRCERHPIIPWTNCIFIPEEISNKKAP